MVLCVSFISVFFSEVSPSASVAVTVQVSVSEIVDFFIAHNKVSDFWSRVGQGELVVVCKCFTKSVIHGNGTGEFIILPTRVGSNTVLRWLQYGSVFIGPFKVVKSVAIEIGGVCDTSTVSPTTGVSFENVMESLLALGFQV